MKQPEALLFDFDGTIVDTEWQIYQAWVRTFEKEGHNLPIATYVQCIGSDFDVWSPKNHLESLTGKTYDWSELDESRNREIRETLEGSEAVEGFPELLREMSGLCPMACVSSSTHSWVDGWLGKLGLANYFTTTVCRGDAPRIKPAPDLYLEAAKQLGVENECCLVVEDSYNGMRAAKEASMKVYVIPSRITEVSDFSDADLVCATSEKLHAALSELFACKNAESAD